MGGSPFCFHGGSMAVRFLLYLPTTRSPFAYSRAPTDFNTNTILILHPAATTHQQACNTVTCKPATLPPHLCHRPIPPCYLTCLPHLFHLSTSTLSPTFPSLPPLLSPLSPTFPTLAPLLSPPPFPPTSLPDLSPPPFPPCHLTPLPHIASPPCHLTSPPPPFPPCHLTPRPNLSHHATSSLLSPTFPTLPPHLSPHLSHLTTLPSFPTYHLTIIPPFPLCHLITLPPFQPSQLTSLPPSQLVTLVLRDLTAAISVTTNKISHSLIEAQPFLCNTNLRSQIPHTSNSPTSHIFSTPSVLTSFK